MNASPPPTNSRARPSTPRRSRTNVGQSNSSRPTSAGAARSMVSPANSPRRPNSVRSPRVRTPQLTRESSQVGNHPNPTDESPTSSLSGFWSIGSGLPPLKKFTKGEMWQTFEYRGDDHSQKQYIPTRTRYIPFHPKPTLFSNVEYDTGKSCPSDVVACSNLPRGFAFLGFHDTKRENLSPRKAAMPKVRIVKEPRRPERFSTRSELMAYRKMLSESPQLQYTSDMNKFDETIPRFHRSAQFTEGVYGFTSTRSLQGKPLGATRLCV